MEFINDHNIPAVGIKAVDVARQGLDRGEHLMTKKGSFVRDEPLAKELSFRTS